VVFKVHVHEIQSSVKNTPHIINNNIMISFLTTKSLILSGFGIIWISPIKLKLSDISQHFACFCVVCVCLCVVCVCVLCVCVCCVCLCVVCVCVLCVCVCCVCVCVVCVCV